MIRTTLIGGVIFLIPVALLAIGLGKTHQIAVAVAAPVHRLVTGATLAGEAAVGLVSILLILAVCYLAGLAAGLSPIARRMQLGRRTCG